MGILGRTVIAACFVAIAAAPVTAEVLAIEDRVAAQRRIEEVYWRHRIWPKDNPEPKPHLSAVLSNAELRLKVEDTLRKSNALEAVWGHAVTSAELQAELDRMIRDTRDPAMLVELFRALGDDPYVIAETLARQALVDRLTRGWYAQDARFHGETKRRAEAARAACRSAADARSAGGNYRETTYARASAATLPDGRATVLDADDWEAHRAALERRFSGSAQAGKLGELEETADGFRFDAILEHGDDTSRIATVTWLKTPFEDWWSQQRARHDVQVVETSGPYTLASPSGVPCTDDTWQSVYTGTPEARAYHTAVWTGSEMIVWGGYGPYRTGGRYTPATDTWVATSLIGAPSERYAHTAVWTGTEMIVFGGTTDSTVGLATGGRYAPSSDTWSTMTDGNNPRWLHTVVWTGSEMIVWGGNGGGQTGARYSPSTDSWAPTMIPNGPSARIEHTAVWTGSEMIIWGGTSSGVAVNDGGRYDPSTNSWQGLTSINAPSARRWHTAVWTGSEMIVWGGDTGSTGVNTGARYLPGSNSWTQTSTGVGVPTGRVEHMAVWTGSRMLVWGGRSGLTVFGTGSEYNPANDSWTGIPAGGGTNSPAARYGATAVWTGQEMVVWGGFDSTLTLRVKTGGRYNPSTTGWLPTSTMSAPTERFGHVAVWTGSEMIVWGGANIRIGGRYDPATDSWTSTPAFPTQQGWDQSAGVWTGTEMIVWGGLPDLFGSGTRYNPTSNSVTQTSVTNAPVPRQYHTAVWTGTQMIVWGGIDGGFNHLSSGGRYTPSSNTWALTSLAGAPTARVAHSAVWAGNQMIIWGGGEFGGAAVNTGGRYDPIGNTWSATSTATGVPTARWYTSTVWTGSDMIVWGGGPATDSTGGRYTPSSNTWTATSTGPHVPSPRLAAATIWTGAQMVVWGGQDSSSAPLDTGARYDAATNTWLPTYPGPELPSARAWPTAVWTGTEMIVWGGLPLNQEGGRYCVPSCATSTVYYRDLDEDGYGNVDQTALGCSTPPPGYSEFSTDCNDGDPSTYPGAPEMCDGEDHNCDTVVDDVVPQEAFFTSVGKTGMTIQLVWSPALHATGYDVARGFLNGFPVGSAVEDCVGDQLGVTFLNDAESVAPGIGFWYLLRGSNSCGDGPWGAGQSTGTCM